MVMERWWRNHRRLALRTVPVSLLVSMSRPANGQTFAGPVLRSAELVCKAHLPPAGGPSPKDRAQQLRRELAFARCMRADGVPNVPTLAPTRAARSDFRQESTRNRRRS
jgi:hypothetical protein